MEGAQMRSGKKVCVKVCDAGASNVTRIIGKVQREKLVYAVKVSTYPTTRWRAQIMFRPALVELLFLSLVCKLFLFGAKLKICKTKRWRGCANDCVVNSDSWRWSNWRYAVSRCPVHDLIFKRNFIELYWRPKHIERNRRQAIFSWYSCEIV